MRYIAPLAIILLTFFILFLFYTNFYSSNNEYMDSFPLTSSDPIIQQAISYYRDNVDANGSFGGLSITSWVAISLSAVGEDLESWATTRFYLSNATATLNMSQATELERHTLALISLQIDPQNVSGINCVQHIIDLYHDGQIGDPAQIQDDIFGILSLRSAGVAKEHEIIQNVTQYIIEQQQDNGSWGDADTTAAALMALNASGKDKSSQVIKKAIKFIHNQQSPSGGFTSWGSTNTATTSWVIMALTSQEIDIFSSEWMQQDISSISYLLSMQHPNGSFYYTEHSHLHPTWMTAYALIAMTGNSFQVNP